MALKNIEALLRMYEEQRTQARHHETQRISITNILISLTVACLGLIGHLKFSLDALPIAIFLIVIGIYGAITTWKLYERSRYHYTRSSIYRDRIDFLSPNELEIKETKQKAVDLHGHKFKTILKLKLHRLWGFLYVTIVIIGVACVIRILIGP